MPATFVLELLRLISPIIIKALDDSDAMATVELRHELRKLQRYAEVGSHKSAGVQPGVDVRGGAPDGSASGTHGGNKT